MTYISDSDMNSENGDINYDNMFKKFCSPPANNANNLYHENQQPKEKGNNQNLHNAPKNNQEQPGTYS